MLLLDRFDAIFFRSLPARVIETWRNCWVTLGLFSHWFLSLLFFFFSSRDQYDVKNDESNGSSIIFAEFTPEKEKSFGESGVENQNNRLVNYTSNLITRDSEFESSSELQGNGLADLSSRSILEHQLPPRHNSDLEENFTSTEESSEGKLNLLGQTEVDYFPQPADVMLPRDDHIKDCETVISCGLPSSSADFPPCTPPSLLLPCVHSLLPTMFPPDIQPLYFVIPPSISWRPQILFWPPCLVSSPSGYSRMCTPELEASFAVCFWWTLASCCKNVFMQKGFLCCGAWL